MARMMQFQSVAMLVGFMLDKVARFNVDVTSLPIPLAPKTLGLKRLGWSRKAMEEEIQEFDDATRAGDVEEAADALVDLVYFALGRLVEMGIPAGAVFEEVQRANMNKVRGELSKRPGSLGHDAVKPEGWTAPVHDWLLGFTLMDMQKARKWDALSPAIQRVVDLRVAKGNDYNAGPTLRDYFPYGHMSYAQMIHVKATRIQSLLMSGNVPKFEGLADSLDDLMNYTIYYREAIDLGLLPTFSKSEVPAVHVELEQ